MIHNMMSGLGGYFVWKGQIIGIILGLLLLLMPLTSCASIQTEPTCKIWGTGQINFINHTDTWKQGKVCRVESTGLSCSKLFWIPTWFTWRRVEVGQYVIGIKTPTQQKTYEPFIHACENITVEIK